MPTKNKPEVSLVGEDGNAFAIIGECVRVARRAGWSAEEIDTLRTEMMSGDYDHLLAVAQEHFEVT